MRDELYNKWFLELSNQEYNGNISELRDTLIESGLY